MHAALEHAQKLCCQEKFNINDVLGSYESALKEQYLTDTEHERYLTHGQEVIKQLFTIHNLRLEQTGQPELRLENIHLGEARLMGVLDRVDASDKQILITDYKTGRPLTSLNTRNKTLQIKAWRHRTQLTYATTTPATKA
jgi:RecB family exonuclease